MPKYFFNVSNSSVKIRDPDGLMFADESAAQAHAQRLAKAVATGCTKSMFPATISGDE